MQAQRERVNDMIRISPVRVIGPNEEQYGVLDTYEAKQLAREAGLDLVEISPHTRPPVCRIMDYGKFKYQQSKKQRKARSNQSKCELKEIRMGRSMRIDSHDIEMRVNQARNFLVDGHKVQFIQPFQGREMRHKELGFERMKGIIKSLEGVAKVEMDPRFNGRRLIMILGPDRVKVKAIKANEERIRLEKERAEAAEKEAADAAKTDAQPELVEEPADATSDAVPAADES